MTAHERLEAWISGDSFSCLGARAALNRGVLRVADLPGLGTPEATAALHAALVRFVAEELSDTEDFATLVAVFDGPTGLDEEQFEALLWEQLALLHRLDARSYAWSDEVSCDPASDLFGFSVAGHPFFVVGAHDGSSRASRRAPFPVLAFNSHRQFRRLRADGVYSGLQKRIRVCELALQGSINPNLTIPGEDTEAKQYSGRAAGPEWSCPFRAEESVARDHAFTPYDPTAALPEPASENASQNSSSSRASASADSDAPD